jgi:hypothetical protein
MPVMGINPTVILTLISVCVAIIVTIPTATSLPQGS